MFRLYASEWMALGVLLVLIFAAPARAANFGPGFSVRSVAVDGGTVSMTVGGSGPPVVLLHGYAETSQMWKPLAIALAPRFTVIAPDLPGIGDSSVPASGADIKTSAQRVHTAMRVISDQKAQVVGHDIGLMVAYAYAAMYPQEVEKLALMDAFIPGVSGWEAVYNNPGLWHFRFYGPTPEALVKGRERTYFEHFWNDFAADKNRSIPEAERRAYTTAYARPGRMAAGFAYFASFPKTAVDFAVREDQLASPSFRSAATSRWAKHWRAGENRRPERDGGGSQGHRPLDHGRTPAGDHGGAAPFPRRRAVSAPCVIARWRESR
jgi:pimeloyl-ACP methyl ester carboxylesterase